LIVDPDAPIVLLVQAPILTRRVMNSEHVKIDSVLAVVGIYIERREVAFLIRVQSVVAGGVGLEKVPLLAAI
jgi:membrane protein YdbS with pleckstrin-like domain